MWTRIVDSGVFLRKPELQVQLGQSNSLKINMTCCFYTGTKGDIYPQARRGKGVGALLKEGDWNSRRIRAGGARFEVWLPRRRPSLVTGPPRHRDVRSVQRYCGEERVWGERGVGACFSLG